MFDEKIKFQNNLNTEKISGMKRKRIVIVKKTHLARGSRSNDKKK